MKKKYSVFGGLLLSLVLVGTSWATSCLCVDGEVGSGWLDDMVFDSSVELYHLSKFTWTHDITDDGFSVREDRKTDAIVEFFFTHADVYDQSLAATGAWWNKGLSSGKDGDFELESKWSWINDLNTYGTLGGKILALPGWYDYFSFNKSISTADDHESILEPATMLLFGTGLAGLAGWRRKAKKPLLEDNGG